MVVRAILFIEFDNIKEPAFMANLQGVALANCKHAVFQISYDEAIIRLDCDQQFDSASLNKAILQDYAGLAGVKRITPLVVGQV